MCITGLKQVDFPSLLLCPSFSLSLSLSLSPGSVAGIVIMFIITVVLVLGGLYYYKMR